LDSSEKVKKNLPIQKKSLYLRSILFSIKLPMSEKKLNFTPDNKQQIKAITATITTVPQSLVQATQSNIFTTLQNGHPLNRLLKDTH
jgi:hypothetical protein